MNLRSISDKLVNIKGIIAFHVDRRDVGNGKRKILNFSVDCDYNVVRVDKDEIHDRNSYIYGVILSGKDSWTITFKFSNAILIFIPNEGFDEPINIAYDFLNKEKKSKKIIWTPIEEQNKENGNKNDNNRRGTDRGKNEKVLKIRDPLYISNNKVPTNKPGRIKTIQ